MKILFERRSISYSITKEEVARVILAEDLEKIVEASFLIRILDGHPTLLLEPTNLFPGSGDADISSWTKPNFIFILRRDGDAGKAVLVDSFDRRLVHD